MSFDASDIMNRIVRRQIADEHRAKETCLQRMVRDCMTSAEAHAAALGNGERPGPGWWQMLHIEYRDGHPSKLRMRYVWPYIDEAKRAREGGE